MRVRARAFWAPKAGNSAEEYEDAFWWEYGRIAIRPYPPGDDGRDTFRCAVADGATETSFSGLWADLLARGFCKGRLDPDALAAGLPGLQRVWRRLVGNRPLPWYAEEKVRSGAFAAVVGLTVLPATAQDGGPEGDGAGPPGGRWRALALGDSCLFRVREDAFVAFPVAHSTEFGNRPALLSSNPAANAGLADRLPCAAGDWLPGDRFYLMTDALACWFLQATEVGGHPWDALRDLAATSGSATFTGWVGELRAGGGLRNDDVTLVMVEV